MNTRLSSFPLSWLACLLIGIPFADHHAARQYEQHMVHRIEVQANTEQLSEGQQTFLMAPHPQAMLNER